MVVKAKLVTVLISIHGVVADVEFRDFRKIVSLFGFFWRDYVLSFCQVSSNRCSLARARGFFGCPGGLYSYVSEGLYHFVALANREFPI